MKFFPESALSSLEFDKIQQLLAGFCKTESAREMALHLRIHTIKSFIDIALHQTHEYKTIFDAGEIFPNDFTFNIKRELKLLSLPGAVLTGQQCILLARLAENTESIIRWFTSDRRDIYSNLYSAIKDIPYEKNIRKIIREVLDENGLVLDHASDELRQIRTALQRKRSELRRSFERMISKLQKLGYLSDIEESFMNGRRVVAVYAENKRMVRGILHAESDSGKTCFIEPEETMVLNNEVITLENEESIEVNRILKVLTQSLSVHHYLLNDYASVSVLYDFIAAKAKLARELNAVLPFVQDKPIVTLINAHHPLLLLHNRKVNKETIPVNLSFDEQNRILVISGPNAGGKTVTMKTMGLLQIMLQAGLLIPASPDSSMGIFKQLMIQIGDTQSIEFELSTYSAHLMHMKHFMEHANGKTLFFIDELGSGSDPNLGGAFAEAILEELARKHSIGIVTTHYLNLKIMAGNTKGIFNGAMLFDENNLMPLYQLRLGSPGSSYTFSIAERIGMKKELIQRARKLADKNQVQLEQLLNKSEQELMHIQKERDELTNLLLQNEKLKKGMQELIKKEQHYQEVEKLKLSNKINEEKLQYIQDTERKIKMLMHAWKKSEDKTEVIKMMQQLFFNNRDKFVSNKQAKRQQPLPEAIKGDIIVGSLVRLGQTRQTGIVKELKGKKAWLQAGNVLITTELKKLVLIGGEKA